MEGKYEWFLMAGNRGMDPTMLECPSLITPVWQFGWIIISANGIHSDSPENLWYSDAGKHGISSTWSLTLCLRPFINGWSNGRFRRRCCRDPWRVGESKSQWIWHVATPTDPGFSFSKNDGKNGKKMKIENHVFNRRLKKETASQQAFPNCFFSRLFRLLTFVWMKECHETRRWNIMKHTWVKWVLQNWGRRSGSFQNTFHVKTVGCEFHDRRGKWGNVGTLQKNVVIDFSPQVVPLAAFFTFFEVTNLAFRRLGNRDAGGCSPFPKTQMTLRFEKVNFNALIEVAKKWLLTCYCIY